MVDLSSLLLLLCELGFFSCSGSFGNPTVESGLMGFDPAIHVLLNV
jgi:hypothetical protein